MCQTAQHGSVRLLCSHPPCEETQVLTPHPNLEAQGPSHCNLFQSAFKVNTMTTAAAAATASGADADTANHHVESAWSNPKGPLLPPKFVVSPRTTSGNQKTGGGIKGWTKLYKRSMHGTRSTAPWRKETWR